ncbi:AzlD domain-containing protein [Anaerosinus gibii]|uniref:AzlD domain-containing protein n=1 Tax=Selenobaculum gibii TaxID=3054208 RepID=A0A9Y2AIZ8_9FIRM|nr:AzlD domain-containing protein [Selenobaculum gbiensis]WIW71202.1 AzlD domain-containing protein [Selenobaculum gbiensis]
MMSTTEIMYCILGMCIVSYIPRALPPFILARVSLSPVVERWLRYVPTSIFGALVFSEIFINGDHLNLSLNNINLLASLIVLVVSLKTKSLAKSIVTGILVYWILTNFI